MNTKSCNISQDSFVCKSISVDSDLDVPKRCVPTQTQIRQQLGSKLSDVFFEFVGDEAKAYLGLEPALVGPDTVWVNPDSRLKSKVAVTPVPEPEVLHLKALTHGSILEVGEVYIQMLENKHRLEIEEALRKQAEELEDEFKRRLTGSDGANYEGTGQQTKIVGTLMRHFDSCFEELVKTTQLRMRKECQLRVKEERAEVAAYMFAQLQDEVERRDMELCAEFHDILYGELNMLASRYIRQINNEREVAVELLRETIRNYEKIIADVRIEAELATVVDVCRAITEERLDSGERFRQLENEIRSKQEESIKIIEQLKEENCTLKKMSTERLKRLMQWRKKIREILQEFQRFINFSMKAVPGQAEYMLHTEKLLLKKYPQDSFLLPEDYSHFMKCLQDKLSDKEQEPETFEPSEGSQKSEETVIGEETSGEETPPYCKKPAYQMGGEPGLTFDYESFKSMLLREFSVAGKKNKPKKKPRKTVCLWKKKTKGASIEESNEMYQILTLAGENEKQHLAPTDCFLKRRFDTLKRICQDDPEFVKIVLGCAEK